LPGAIQTADVYNRVDHGSGPDFPLLGKNGNRDYNTNSSEEKNNHGSNRKH